MYDVEKIVLFALSVVLVIIMIIVISNQQSINKMITECEKHLPRDQHCQLVATPVITKEE